MAGAVLVGAFVFACVCATMLLGALCVTTFRMMWKFLKWVWKQ